MNLHNSYFTIANPIQLINKWFNPPSHSQTIRLQGENLFVQWTHRADKILHRRSSPLIIEMQLYFSCMVKKRVLFHETFEHETLTVNDAIEIAFRPVQSTSCDPVEFANNFPVKQQLTSTGAKHMTPASLELDYVNGQWQGEFSI